MDKIVTLHNQQVHRMSQTNNTDKATNVLPLFQALIPLIILVAMLFINVVYAFGDDALRGRGCLHARLETRAEGCRDLSRWL